MVDLTKITTVSETVKHPSYPDATWNLRPTRHGLLPVAVGRGGPLKISWEIHGEGPIRIVFIMGLGSFKSAWQRQTLHFGHERHKEFSVLVIDNRGLGDSDKPLMRYSTSEMALDVLEVLEHVGFVEPGALDSAASSAASGKPSPRPVHVVGLSMGGMIAQELALRVPGQIASLALCCTAAQIENTSPTIWENIKSRAALVIPKGVEESVQGTAGRIFDPSWLVRPDDVHLPERGTHRVGPPERFRYHADKTVPPTQADIQVQEDFAASGSADDDDDTSVPWYGTFDSNYQRFVAQEMHKRLDPRFSLRGFLLQLIAAGWHYKSPQQLATLGDRVGRERILVMHGTADNMISVPHGRKLIEHIRPKRAHIVEGMGHAPVVERWAWYNSTLEELFREGEKLAGR